MSENPRVASPRIEFRPVRSSSARSRWRAPEWVYPTGTTLTMLVIWEVLTPLLGVPSHILPRPSEILLKILEQLPRLWPHIIVTSVEALGGLLLSIAVAVPLAIALVYLPLFERSIYPLLVSTQAIPKIAIAPLFIVWFGFGPTSKFLVAFLVAFFPVLIDTVVGLKSVNPEYINLVRAMRANEWQVLARIRAPYALPHFFAGLKVAVTLAVIGALVGEFMGADVGLGYMLLVANGFVDTKLLFAVLILLALMGIIFFYCVVAIERMMIPWHVSQRTHRQGRTSRGSRGSDAVEDDLSAEGLAPTASP